MVETTRKQQKDIRELNKATREQRKGEIYYAQVETTLPSGKKAGDKVIAGRQRINSPQSVDLSEG